MHKAKSPVDGVKHPAQLTVVLESGSTSLFSQNSRPRKGLMDETSQALLNFYVSVCHPSFVTFFIVLKSIGLRFNAHFLGNVGERVGKAKLVRPRALYWQFHCIPFLWDRM